MEKLRLLNLGYRYNDEDDIWYKEKGDRRVELDILSMEISYQLMIGDDTYYDTFDRDEEFDIALELIENILKG